MNPPSNQPGRFKIDYLLKPKKGILKNIFGNDEQVILTLNFETKESSYRENIEIETSGLEAGEYTLSFTVSGPETDQFKRQELSIVIVE